MDVAKAGLDQKREVDTVARNLVAHQAEFHRLLDALAQDRDVNRRSLGPLEQIGNVGSAHVVGGLAVDGNDHVARMDSRLVGRRSDKWEDDDDFIVARADRHSDAVVLAALFLAEQRVRLGIEEVGVRVERVQHARNGAVVDGFVGVDRLGVVVLDNLVHLCELLQAVFDVGIATGRSHGTALREQHAQKATGYEDYDDQQERATRTTSHLQVLSLRHKAPKYRTIPRSIACATVSL